ncbi:MAG: decarboxylase [Desulfurococcaceae archaeon]
MSTKNWDVEISRELYGIRHSIRGDVIDIDGDGYLVVKLGDKDIRVKDIMDKHGFDIAYIRILPLIDKSMKLVHETFTTLARVHGFKGGFIPVYPMKVNPTRIVVEAIMRYGDKYNWGFNVGSPGELELLIEISEKHNPRLLIYDGVVSETVLNDLMKLVERKWHIIVDIGSERDIELLSKYPDLEIGLRIKPLFRTMGKWADSTGLGSKFGLALNTLLRLKDEFQWIMERSTLLHMHAGSQIYRLQDIKSLFREIKSMFTELRRIGFNNINLVDCGGGMAYPYFDSREGSFESPDYSIVDYINEMIKAFNDISPPPTLIYEGGRFITASHRVVVARVIDVRPYYAEHKVGEYNGLSKLIESANTIEDIKDLLLQLKSFVRKNGLFKKYTIERREIFEEFTTYVKDDLARKLSELIKKNPHEIRKVLEDPDLRKLLISPSKRFLVNISIFADIPDNVLVDQYFQVVPVQRLNEKPDVLATISDLTCDSMGEFKVFISKVNSDIPAHYWFTEMDSKLMFIPGEIIKLHGVPLHLLNKDERYYIAFLDTGAYQDPLAMKHNLIYGAPEIIIDLSENGVEIRVEKCKKPD